MNDLRYAFPSSVQYSSFKYPSSSTNLRNSLFDTKNLDVLDYVERLREKKIHTPTGFNPMIVGDIQTTKSKIQKTNS